MNNEQARINMISQQIRADNVLNPKVLSTMQALPREKFVPKDYKSLAFADISIPLEDGQAMLSPRDEAHCLQALGIKATDKIVQLGANDPFLTAALAKHGKFVYCYDQSEALTAFTASKLASAGVKNVQVQQIDKPSAWMQEGPYDIIVIAASVARLSQAYCERLANKGRLFAIVGHAPAMEAKLVTRVSHHQWQQTTLFETTQPRLLLAGDEALFSL